MALDHVFSVSSPIFSAPANLSMAPTLFSEFFFFEIHFRARSGTEPYVALHYVVNRVSLSYLRQ